MSRGGWEPPQKIKEGSGKPLFDIKQVLWFNVAMNKNELSKKCIEDLKEVVTLLKVGDKEAIHKANEVHKKLLAKYLPGSGLVDNDCEIALLTIHSYLVDDGSTTQEEAFDSYYKAIGGKHKRP